MQPPDCLPGRRRTACPSRRAPVRAADGEGRPWRGTSGWSRHVSRPVFIVILILVGCVSTGPNPPMAFVADLLAEGDTFVGAGHFTAAEARYRQALDLATTDPRPALALADLYLAWQRPADGLAALDTAARRGAPESESEIRRLWLLGLSRDWDAAAGVAEAILADHRASPEAHAALVTAHLERGACDEAHVASQRALEAGVEHPEVVIAWAVLEEGGARLAEAAPSLWVDPFRCGAACDRALGLRLVGEGRWALAACVLERAVAAGPDDAEAQAWYGEALARTGRPRAAYTHLRRSVELAPELPQAWLLLGALALSTGDLGQARVALLNAQRLDPTNPAPCLAVAELKAQAGSYDEVDRWTEAALDRAPDDVAVAKAIARFYLSRALMDSPVGRRAAERAVHLAPEDAEALTLVGWRRLALGNPEDALQALDAAVISAPTYGEAHYWRAQALLALGAGAEARTVLTRAADLGFPTR
jgi:tetratricopeptide (TPR) repeat protein